MNQLEQYHLRLNLSASLKRLSDELGKLTTLAASLPYCPCCPCCPGKGSLCLIDWLRHRDSTADIETLSQRTGISQENIKSAVAMDYTLTEDEMQRLCDWMDYCNDAFQQKP